MQNNIKNNIMQKYEQAWKKMKFEIWDHDQYL